MRFHTFRVACLTVAFGGAVASSAIAADARRTLVKSADSWAYQLQGNVGHIAASRADMVVVDPDHAGGASRFSKKPGGGRRANSGS